MRPPDTLAIEKALDVLLKSIKGEDTPTFTLEDPLHTGTGTIDLDVEAVRLAVERLTFFATEWVVKVNRRRNTLVKISSLPTELVMIIFKYALEADGGWNRRREGIHSLAKVSLRWRDIILSSPSIWAVIDIAERPEWVQLSIRKSLTAALDIRCRQIREPDEGIIPLYSSIKTAGLYAYRWKSIEVYPHHGPATVLEYLEKPLPLLDTINLNFEHTAPPLVLHCGPNLRSVRLVKVEGLRWKFNGLSHLNHLSISRTGLSFSQIISVLVASPELQILALFDIQGRSDMSSPSTTQNLPKLTTLQLRSLSPAMTSNIIRHIDAPNLQTLRITSEETPEPNIPLTWMALLDTTGKEDSMISTVLKKLDSQEYISIVAGSRWEVHLFSSVTYGRLYVKLHGENMAQGVVESGPRIPSASISCPVHLSCDSANPVLDPAFLGRFPTMVRLTVDGNEQEIHRS